MGIVQSVRKILIAASLCALTVGWASYAQQEPSPAPPSDAASPVESPGVTAGTPSETASPDAAPAADLQPLAEERIDSSYPGQIPDTQKEQGQAPMPELSLGEPVKESRSENPFWSDATLKLQLRNFYFHREKYDDSHVEAWAQGASLSFKSGYFADRFAIGAVGYTSLPIQAEDGLQGSKLLDTEPGGYNLRFDYDRDSGWSHYLEQRIHQDSYAVLGQIYGEFKITDSLLLDVGRKEYNTPYVNLHDVRMTPKTFEGISLAGTHEGASEDAQWRYGLGYLTKMKDWTDSSFYWMSEDLGVEKERGVILGGVNYSNEKFSLGAIDYYSDDIINIFYTEGSYAWKFTPMLSLKLSGQFTDQRSTGDDLIMGEDFNVQAYGVKTDLQYGPATLTLAYTDVSGDNTDMRSPWGGYPGYTSVQVTDFNRSGESAFMVKAAYDFTHLGLNGVSAYALWVDGSDRKDPSEDVEVYDENEWNVNLQWAPKEGRFKDLNLRVRYAEIEQDGNGDPKIKDFRVIANYNFALK